MNEDRAPHDGAQSQVNDEPTGASTATSASATPPPPLATQPAIAAPGKPDGEVDTRR